MGGLVDKVVRFLIKEHALVLGGSPWPDVGPAENAANIDWARLFPTSRPARDGDFEWDLLGDGWNPEFSEELLNEIDRALGVGPPDEHATARSRGSWDVCAWYQPVHFFGYAWGIYIREDCARRLAVSIARFMTGVHKPAGSSRVRLAKALVRAAIYAYFLHEHYHHKVECLGVRLHVVERTSRYLPYQTMVYQKTAGTDDQLEEALANADMFHRLPDEPYRSWLSDPVLKALRSYLGWSFPHDPPGYKQASHFISAGKFDRGENLLHGQVKEAALTPAQPPSEWDIAPRLMQSFFSVKSDIWTVLPLGVKSNLPIKHVAPVRTCSTAEMIKLFKRNGYAQVDGGKGSHVKLVKAGAPTMILPERRELSPGVAKTAVRVLGDFNLRDLRELIAGRLELGGDAE